MLNWVQSLPFPSPYPSLMWNDWKLWMLYNIPGIASWPSVLIWVVSVEPFSPSSPDIRHTCQQTTVAPKKKKFKEMYICPPSSTASPCDAGLWPGRFADQVRMLDICNTKFCVFFFARSTSRFSVVMIVALFLPRYFFAPTGIWKNQFVAFLAGVFSFNRKAWPRNLWEKSYA